MKKTDRIDVIGVFQTGRALSARLIQVSRAQGSASPTDERSEPQSEGSEAAPAQLQPPAGVCS